MSLQEDSTIGDGVGWFQKEAKCLVEYYNCPSVNTIILKKTMLFIKYGYMFRLFLSHPQTNVVTEFRYIKCAPNGIPLCLQNISHEIWDPIRYAFYIPKFCDHIGLRMA